MSKHTPGPWNIAEDQKSGALWIESGETGSVGICDMYHTDQQGEVMRKPNTEKNCYLIAAAPDLLEALYEALPFVNDDDGAFKNGYAKKVERRILAAINKAEGKA